MEGAAGGFLAAGAEGMEAGEVSPPNPAGAPLAGLGAAAGLECAVEPPPAWNLGGSSVPVARKQHADDSGATAARLTIQ